MNAKIVFIFIVLFISSVVQAARVKDIASIRGVRSNQLFGYGLVVGLSGTGDSKMDFTNKSIARMLDKMGMKVGAKEISSKNIAAVLITATLPPFARAGNRMDITINSIGDASSLKGGTLVLSPIRAADQQIYAVGQGSILVGDNTEVATVGRIPNGAIIERDVGGEFQNRKMFRMTLHNPDFTTAARLARKINMELAGKYASARDASTVDLVSPSSYEGKGVELLAMIESLEISPDNHAKIIVNEKTGTVVIGSEVILSPVAITHGDLTIRVGNAKSKKGGDRILQIKKSANIGDIVKAMNSLGVSPKDLITILQSIKAAGALQGEIEIL